MDERIDIPCTYVVAEYLNGENQLPLLRPAVDAMQAQTIAVERSKDKFRPVVKVFSFEGGVSKLMMTIRGPSDGRPVQLDSIGEAEDKVPEVPDARPKVAKGRARSAPAPRRAPALPPPPALRLAR